jgi:hypothetical protein
MSLLNPDISAARDPAPTGFSPNTSILISAAGAFAALYFVLTARVKRVELAHALLARGR